jgi:hypothetical protein
MTCDGSRLRITEKDLLSFGTGATCTAAGALESQHRAFVKGSFFSCHPSHATIGSSEPVDDRARAAMTGNPIKQGRRRSSGRADSINNGLRIEKYVAMLRMVLTRQNARFPTIIRDQGEQEWL